MKSIGRTSFIVNLTHLLLLKLTHWMAAYIVLVALAFAGLANASPEGICEGKTQFLADSNDCGCYYRCTRGVIADRLECPEGLHFSVEHQRCTSARLARCGSAPAAGKTCPSSVVCPGPPTDLVNLHLPHPSDCSKFCHCSHGVAHEKDCPPGLHFNADLQVCDWPWRVNCDGSSPSTAKPPPSSSATPSSPPTAAPSSPPTSPPCNSTSKPPASANVCPPTVACPGPPTDVINLHLPYPNDCTKFCHCSHGVAYEKDCPPGLHFNAVLQVCDWPKNAGCDGSVASTAKPPPSSPPTSPPTTAKPPSSTTAAPPATTKPPCSTTKPPSTAGVCPSSVVCPGPPTDIINLHLPHPYDCTKFCHCSHGVAYLKDCPAGLHFNADLQVCDWPWNAGCVASSTSSTSASTPPLPSVPPGHPPGDRFLQVKARNL